MRNILLTILFFLLGLAFVLGLHYWNQQSTAVKTKNSAPATSFSIEKAPSASLQGTIASMSGTVTWLSRTASKPVRLQSPRALQQGEEISTGPNGKVLVNIKNYSSLLLLPNSDLSIMQLLPQNFVFVQNKGTVRYENTIQVPVSVKSFDVVTILTMGIMDVTVDPVKQTATITVVKGIVNEGYEDLQNNSVVTTVNEGQTFVFDETNKVGSVQ